MTVYALFDSSGNLIGMDSDERDGYEQVEFNFGDRIVKVDGAVREMTADEIAAADTAANNAALAEIHRGERNRLLAESDFVVTRRWKLATAFLQPGLHIGLRCAT